jgi:O-antigen ligase
VLASSIAARRRFNRILFFLIFGAGCVAMLLTFSRSGMLGLAGSIAVLFPLARWSRLISRQAFAWCIMIAVMAVALSTPPLIDFFETRPIAVTGRLELIAIAEETYLRHPILGAGLNNSSAVTEGSHETISTQGGPAFRVLVVHNHYLIVLIEVGAIGFLLFFGFFGATAMTALRSMRAAGLEMKLLLVGLVSAMAGIAVHNFGDPFGGHMCRAMLWLTAALVFAICRRVQAEAVLPAPIAAEPAGRALPSTAGWSQALINEPRPSTP